MRWRLETKEGEDLCVYVYVYVYVHVYVYVYVYGPLRVSMYEALYVS